MTEICPFHVYGCLAKTTLNIRDDLYRRAKAQAALEGKTLGRLLEESLERMLELGDTNRGSWRSWARSLPALSDVATQGLEAATSAPDFRPIDPEMLQ